MKKANDWLSVLVQSPGVNLGDLYDSGITPENTSLRSREDYVNTKTVQDKFTSTETGRFDEKSFNKFYDAVVENYNLFQKTQPVNLFSVPEDTWVASSYSKGREKNTVKLSTLTSADPFLKLKTNQGSIFGASSFGKWSKPLYSEAELAQQQKVVDYKTGKVLDYTPEDMSLFGSLTLRNEPLVLARYDQDILEESGNIKHHKGELKLDENGNPHYETLGDRSPQGRQVLSAWDTLTREGTTLNKFDFMDSDDIEKSITGIIAKNIVIAAPAFIPYVGNVYATAIVAKNLAEVGVIGYQSLSGILNNPDTSKGYGNKVLGKLQTLTTGMSEQGKKSFWTLESIAGLVTDSVLQLKTQRFIAEAPLQIATLKYKAGLGGTMDTIKAAAQARGMNASQTASFVNQFAIGQNYKNYEKVAKAANWASTAYMASTSATEIYNNAVSTGLASRDSGLLYLGFTMALAPLFRADVGQIALKGIGLSEADKIVRSVIKKELSKGSTMFTAANEAAAASAAHAAGSTTSAVAEGSKNFIAKGFEIGKKALNKLYSINDVFERQADEAGKVAVLLGIAEGAYSEGVEEVSEFMLQKGLEYMYNGLNSAGYTATEEGIRYNYTATQLWQELVSTAVGGALGGAVFKSIDKNTGKAPFEYTLVDAVNAGYSDALFRTLDKMKVEGQIPGSTDLSFKPYEDSDGEIREGVFQPVGEHAKSQQEFLYDKVKDNINLVKTILDSHGILSHHKIISSKNELINNITDLNIDSSIYTALRDVSHEIVDANMELNKLIKAELPDTDLIEKAKERLNAAKAEYDRLTSDESTDEFLREALFNMNGKAMSYIGLTSKDEITQALVPEFTSYASLVAASETNEALKEKKIEIDNKYNEYTKTPEFRSKLRDTRRALEEFTESTPDGQAELDKYANILSKFINANLLAASTDVNYELAIQGNENLGSSNQEAISNDVAALAQAVGVSHHTENFLGLFPKVKELLGVVKEVGYMPAYLKRYAHDAMQQAGTEVLSGVTRLWERSPELKTAEQDTQTKPVVGGLDFQMLLSDIISTEGSAVEFIKTLYELAASSSEEEKIEKKKLILDILTRAGHADQYTEADDLIIQTIPVSVLVDMFNEGGTSVVDLVNDGKYSFNPAVLSVEYSDDGYEIGVVYDRMKNSEGEATIVSNTDIEDINSHFSGLTYNQYLESIKDAQKAIDSAKALSTPFDNLLGNIYKYIEAQEKAIISEGPENYVNNSKEFTEAIDAYMSQVKQLLGAIVTIGEINPVINSYRNANPDKLSDKAKTQRFLTIDSKEYGYPAMLSEVQDVLARLRYFKDLNAFNANNTTKRLKQESALYTKLHSKELVELYNTLNSLESVVPDDQKAAIKEFITSFMPTIDSLTSIGNLPLEDLTDEVMVESFVNLTKAEKLFYDAVGTIFNIADDAVKRKMLDVIIPDSISIDSASIKNTAEHESLTLNNKSLYRFRLLTTDPIKMYKGLNGTPDNTTGLTPEQALPLLWSSPYAPYQSQAEAVIMGYVLNKTSSNVWSMFTKKIYSSDTRATNNVSKTLAVTAPAGAGKTTAVIGGIINSFANANKKILVVAPEQTQAKVIFDSARELLGADSDKLSQSDPKTVDQLLTDINSHALEALNKIKVKGKDGNYLTPEQAIAYMIDNFGEYTKLIDDAINKFLSDKDKAEPLHTIMGDVDLIVVDEATHVPAHILYFLNKLYSKVNPEGSMIFSGDELQMGASINGARFNLERIYAPKTTRLSTSVRSRFDLVAEVLGEIQMISEHLVSIESTEVSRYKFPKVHLAYDPKQVVGFTFTDRISSTKAAIEVIASFIEKLREDSTATLLYIAEETNISEVTTALKNTYPDVFDNIVIQTPESTVFATANVVTPKSAQSMQASYVVIDAAPTINESSNYKNRRIAEFYNTMMTRVKNAGIIIDRGNHKIEFSNSPNREANTVLKFTPEAIQEFKNLEINKLLPIVMEDTTVSTGPVSTPASKGAEADAEAAAKERAEKRAGAGVENLVNELEQLATKFETGPVTDALVADYENLINRIDVVDSDLFTTTEEVTINAKKSVITSHINVFKGATGFDALPNDLKNFDYKKILSEEEVTQFTDLVKTAEQLNLPQEDISTLKNIKTELEKRKRSITNSKRGEKDIKKHIATIELFINSGVGELSSTQSALNVLKSNENLLTKKEKDLITEATKILKERTKEADEDIKQEIDKIKTEASNIKSRLTELKKSIGEVKLGNDLNFSVFTEAIQRNTPEASHIEELKTLLNRITAINSNELNDSEADIQEYIEYVENTLPHVFNNELAFKSVFDDVKSQTLEGLIALKSSVSTLEFSNNAKSEIITQIDSAIRALVKKSGSDIDIELTDSLLGTTTEEDADDISAGNKKRSNFYISVPTTAEQDHLKNTINTVIQGNKPWAYKFNSVRSQLLGIPTQDNFLTKEDLKNTTIVFESIKGIDDKIHNKVKAIITRDGLEPLVIPLGYSISDKYVAFNEAVSIPYNKVADIISTTPQNLKAGNEIQLDMVQAVNALFSNAYTVHNLTLTVNPINLSTMDPHIQQLINDKDSENRSMSNGAMFSLMVYNKQLAKAHEIGAISDSDLFLVWLQLSQENKNSKKTSYKTVNITINGVTYSVREFDVQPIIYTSPKIPLSDYMKILTGKDAKGMPLRNLIFGNDSSEKIVSSSVVTHISTLIKAAITTLKAENHPLVQSTYSNLIEGLTLSGNKADYVLNVVESILRFENKNTRAQVFIQALFKGDDTIEFINKVLEAVADKDLKDDKNEAISKASDVFISIPFLAQKGQSNNFINNVDVQRVNKLAKYLGLEMKVSFGMYERPGISFLHNGETLNSILASKNQTEKIVIKREDNSNTQAGEVSKKIDGSHEVTTENSNQGLAGGSSPVAEPTNSNQSSLSKEGIFAEALTKIPTEYQSIGAGLMGIVNENGDVNGFLEAVNIIPLEAFNSSEFSNFVDAITEYAIKNCK